MKLIIAGGREFNDYDLLKTEVMKFILENDGKPGEVEIVSGKARGADNLGERFATEWDFPILEYPADWNKNGKAAGPIRNEEMAKVATHCIVFWDGKSSGSGHMIRTAKKYNLIQKTIHYQ